MYKGIFTTQELKLLERYKKMHGRINELNLEMLELSGVKGFQASTDSTVKIWNKLHSIADKMEKQLMVISMQITTLTEEK